jgi:hypothetical protein
MKVITCVVNNPIFIEIQYKLLNKYLRGGDFEFIVFNDAKEFPDYTNDGDVTIRKQIQETCKNLGIKCINLENNYQQEHSKNSNIASTRTGIGMNIMLNYQKENPDKYLILDSDMFLIDYMDVNKYDGYKCAFVLQSRENNYRYMWNGLVYMDMNLIKDDINDLDWGLTPFTDTGGKTRDWLERQFKNEDIYVPTGEELRYKKDINYNSKSLYFIKHLWSMSWNESEIPENLKEQKELISFMKNDMRNKNNNFYCEIYDNIFLHYRNGGNWVGEGLNFHNNHSSNLKKILLKD